VGDSGGIPIFCFPESRIPPTESSMLSFTSTCPRCHKAPLFDGLLKVVDICPNCGLNLKDHDAGDGPAFFAILLVGFLVTFAAGAVEYLFAPPFWVHALLWVPLTLATCLLVLRVAKSMLIHWQYRLALLKEQPK
jgi:uncharacterized protein (DUF983 family)